MVARIPKKKAQQAAFDGPEPKLEVVKKSNLQKEPGDATVPFQLKISSQTRKEFKNHATDLDMTASQLFEELWVDYKSRNF
ncbi:MAG: hypothetical protein ACPGSC_11565 [Granulosicoccaceae bacterium]